MNKINNKGFMLAELMIASVMLIGTIVGLYTGFNRLYSNYKLRNNYDRAEDIYGIKSIKDFLIDQYKMNSLIKNNANVVDITNCNNTVFTCDTSENNYYNSIKGTYGISQILFTKYNIRAANVTSSNEHFQAYLNYLKKDVNITSSIYSNGYRIIVEFLNQGSNVHRFSNIPVGNIIIQGGVNLDTSKANVPKTIAGMIPVLYDGSKWIKADSDNGQVAYQWYNYNQKKWANAVMVTTSSRDTYMSASIGTPVLDADILAYFVWVPRYKYKLFNVSFAAGTTPRTIDIVFEEGLSKTGTGTTNGTYKTHPAFTFGGVELTGMWVGKFETTGNNTAPTIKHSQTSIYNIPIARMYDTTKFFQSSTYLSGAGLNNVDAHLMKNTEWGAVAYLTLSKYGKNSEVTQNVSGITGGGASNAYKTNIIQSTTGDITGIYDMSGGRWEYVMGNYANYSGSSGFGTIQSSQYINIYSGTSAGYSQLGDALGETVGWYGDYQNFIYYSYPWFVRGSDSSATSGAGIFSYSYTTGAAGHAFRTVVVKK